MFVCVLACFKACVAEASTSNLSVSSLLDLSCSNFLLVLTLDFSYLFLVGRFWVVNSSIQCVTVDYQMES